MHATGRRLFIIVATVFALICISGICLGRHGEDLSNRALDAGICGNQPCTGNEVDTYGDGYNSLGQVFFFVGGCGFLVAGTIGGIVWVMKRRRKARSASNLSKRA